MKNRSNSSPRALILTGLAFAATSLGVAQAAPAQADNNVRPMSHIYHSQVPRALFNVSEDSEDLYDQAFAANWKKASAALDKISRDDATLLRTEPALHERSARLATLVTAVKRQIAASDRPAALRDINQMTRLTIEMSASYTQSIPVEVSLLDFYGRELQVWAIANNPSHLKSTLRALQKTWQSVRPQVVARPHGDRAARSFDAMVARAHATQTPNYAVKVAAPLLEEVDSLENVFGA